LKTTTLIAIAIICSVGILAAFFVIGGMYQQELFAEYMKDMQNSPNSRHAANSDMPVFDIP